MLKRLWSAVFSAFPAAAPPAATSIEASIATLTASVAVLQGEVDKAKEGRDRWLAKCDEEGLSEKEQADAEAKLNRYQGLVDKAQAALQEEKKLLDNAERRQLEEKKLAAKTGKRPPPPKQTNPPKADGQIRIPEFSPSPTFQPNNVVDFVTSGEWDTIYGRLLDLAKGAPTSDFRNLFYVVVFGIMGSGKSTTVWKAITQVREKLPDKNYIPCYLRLDNLEKLFPTFESENSNVNVLATALLACFTNGQVVVHGSLNLQQVGELAREKYASNNFLLHIDEFQSSPSATKQLLIACRETIRNDSYGICVVPIVSGIPGLDFPVEASKWPHVHVQLGPLPKDEIWNSFLEAINVPLCPFGEYENLSILFNDCGAYASQVVSLAQVIKGEYPQLHGDLTAAEAWHVFDKTLVAIQGVYGAPRWHAMFSKTNYIPTHGSPAHRSSWPTTVNIIKQVMLFVSTKKTIPDMTKEVVAGITWEKCKLTGMVDFVQTSNNTGWIATCSSFALFVMNDMVKVIPPVARLKNVFDNGWQAHERIALVSFMLRLKLHDVGERVLLEDCRPQAYCQKNAKVEIKVPDATVFQPEEKGLTVNTDLSVGKFLLTADNEAGVDGIMLFDGFVDDKERQILVLSQSKKRGNSTKGGVNTGVLSTERKSTSDVVPLLPLMRDAKAKLPLAVREAFVVLDLFTDWIGPARDWVGANLVLVGDEALIITEWKHLDSVMGGLAGIKREVPM